MNGQADRVGHADPPIAVVGVGALFPGADDAGVFWRNIVDGTDTITDVPRTHWNIEDYYDPDPTAVDKTYCRRGGFLPTVPFDPLQFGIPPNTLGVTDILQLLGLIVARDTLADLAQGRPRSHDPARTGVVLGVTGANSLTQPLSARLQTPVVREVARSMGLSEQDTEELADRFVKAFAPWEENSFPGMLGNVVAGRIANRFDLGGMNCTVDAACASSLAALNTAVGELATGRADVMLTGGCDAENTIFMYLCFSKTPAFSRSGVIRPFDQESDGTLIGEGLGMLALKRLADAEADGDRIYAVIRGTGSSSDGRHKSIYAPRADGQQLALRRAYEAAGVGPADIAMLECHGTGTAVGDRTELDALSEVYGQEGVAPGSVAVGSIKSQIGHTKAAAGAASLIKMALALHHRVLPPTINVTRPVDALRDSPFHLAVHSRPWIADGTRTRRRAAVSSFGFGGTNFHCVLEEADPDATVAATHDVAEVTVWHTPSPEELLTAVENGAPGGDPDEPVPAEHARLAVVSRGDRDAVLREVADRLRSDPGIAEFETGSGACYRRSAEDHGRIALLCAGQGSQYVGMGRTAALAVDPVRAALDRAGRAFEGTPSLGLITYPPTAFDDDTRRAQEELLRRTENAQPAIGALAAGHLNYLRAVGLQAEGALGHSFGELTALWAAGSITEPELHALARARGLAMAETVAAGGDPGTMLAVRAGAEALAELLTAHPDVYLCNVNAPDQIVVGGGTDAVTAFAAALAERSISAQRLDVAAAFHTPIVAGAVTSFRAALARVIIGEPRFAVYSDTEGAGYGPDLAANAEVLARQLTEPVRFADRLGQLYDDGFRTFVEIGPRRTLSGLVRHTLGDRAEPVRTIAVDGGPGADADTELKRAAARLLVLGLPLTGLNRFTAPRPPDVAASQHALWLNGANHVPEQRRAAYQAALAAGPVAVEPGPAEPAPVVPAPTPGTTTGWRNPVVNEPSQYGAESAGEPLGQHLATHDEFLRGQLGVAQRLAALLEQGADGGAVDPNLAAGINAISQQSVAISHSHARANEVLCGLAELAQGHQPSERYAQFQPEPAALTNGHNAGGYSGNGRSFTDFDANGDGHNGGGYDGNGSANGYGSANGHGGNGSAPTSATGLVEFDVPEPPPVPAPAPPPPAAPAAAAPAPVAHAPEPPADEPAGRSYADMVLGLVSDKTGYPPEMLETGMDMEADLGIDSIKRVEIMSGLRDQLPGGDDSEPPEVGAIRTLGDLIDLVTRLAGGVVADPKAGEGADGTQLAGTAPHGVITGGLRPMALSEPEQLADPYRARTALLAGTGQLAAEFAALLRRHGWTVCERLDPAHHPDLVVSFAAANELDTVLADLRDTLLLAGRVLPGLREATSDGRAAFLTVTRLDGAGGLAGGADRAASAFGGLAGLVRTMALEAPEVFCRQVDLHPGLSGATAADLLLAEVLDADPGHREVGRGTGGERTGVAVRETETTAPATVAAPGSGDLFVVSGGGRGVTAACAIGLAQRYRTGLLLLGRTEPVEEPAELRELPDERLRAALIERAGTDGWPGTPRQIEAEARRLLDSREIRRTVRTIEQAGAEVRYLAVDVTDRAALTRALTPFQDRITGVVHGAGSLADAHLVDKRAETVDPVLAVKLAGFDALLGSVRTEALRHVVVFSSVAGLYGNEGQADYAMANSALDRQICALRREHPGLAAHALAWGAWEGGMVTPELARLFAARGVRLVPVPEGVRRFVEHFDPGQARDAVRFIGPPGPLSGPTSPDPADREFTVVRDLAEVAGDPVVRAHVIAGCPVLPLTAVLGGALRIAESAVPVPGRWTVRELRVYRGLVFDPTGPAPSRLAVGVRRERPADGGSLELTMVDEDNRPRYRATLVTAESPVPPPPPEIALPPLGESPDATDPYADGTLFHGPALRGIRHLLAQRDDQVVVSCRLADDVATLPGYRTAGYSPVLTDLLPQAALVWAQRVHGEHVLPLAMRGVELCAPLPSDAEFVVLVAGVRTSGGLFTCATTAATPTGQVLVHIAELDLAVADVASTAR